MNLLSRATYESFPGVLRELVSNSYDADATEVRINVDLTKKEIVVSDDGNGMSPDQFQYFLAIAATPRSPLPSPKYRRERIGRVPRIEHRQPRCHPIRDRQHFTTNTRILCHGNSSYLADCQDLTLPAGDGYPTNPDAGSPDNGRQLSKATRSTSGELCGVAASRRHPIITRPSGRDAFTRSVRLVIVT